MQIVNDAAMQALGGYKGGKMLFLGLGTGLGSTLIVDGVIVPMELAHLPYKRATFEDYVGNRALERAARRNGGKRVADVIERRSRAMEPEDVVLGGGNAEKLKRACRRAADSATTRTRSPAGFACGAGADGQRQGTRDGGLRAKTPKEESETHGERCLITHSEWRALQAHRAAKCAT